VRFRVLSALVVFLGSYLPLSLILLAQDCDYARLRKLFCGALSTGAFSLPFKNATFAVGTFLVCLASFLVTLVVLETIRPKNEIVVSATKYVPTDLMNYTLPYIVSFMSVSYDDPNRLIGFFIFLGWMFWINYKSGQIILNPLLIVLGWRLYEISYRFAGSNDLQIANALVKGRVEACHRYRQIAVQDILIIKSNDAAGG